VNPPTGHFTSPMALISAALLLVATIVVAVFVRVIETRDRSGNQISAYITYILILFIIEQDNKK
jgi:heme/copper-type cytochrome/quinol oxidase subunit 3